MMTDIAHGQPRDATVSRDAIVEPPLHNLYCEWLATCVRESKALKPAENGGVGPARSHVAKAEQPKEALDRVRVPMCDRLHGNTAVGTSRATARRSSVASFRCAPVDTDDRCPRMSPIALSDTAARSRLTARACRKVCGPFLPDIDTPAASTRFRTAPYRLDPSLSARYGACRRRNTSRRAVRGRARSRYARTASPGSRRRGRLECAPVFECRI